MEESIQRLTNLQRTNSWLNKSNVSCSKEIRLQKIAGSVVVCIFAIIYICAVSCSNKNTIICQLAGGQKKGISKKCPRRLGFKQVPNFHFRWIPCTPNSSVCDFIYQKSNNLDITDMILHGYFKPSSWAFLPITANQVQYGQRYSANGSPKLGDYEILGFDFWTPSKNPWEVSVVYVVAWNLKCWDPWWFLEKVTFVGNCL